MVYTSIICSLDSLAMTTVLSGVGFFLGVTLLLVIILLIAKKHLVQSGEVIITMNGDTKVKAQSGKSLLSTAVGMRRKRQLRPVPSPGGAGGRRASADRSRAFHPQRA